VIIKERGGDMKNIQLTAYRSGDQYACAKAVEILHTQGIESAELWLNSHKINRLYDRIEEQYLRMKKYIRVH
jgi:hypothetical protein